MEDVIFAVLGAFALFMVGVGAWIRLSSRWEERRQKRDDELWQRREKQFNETTARLSKDVADLTVKFENEQARARTLSEQVTDGKKELDKTLELNTALQTQLTTISGRLDSLLEKNNKLDGRVASLEQALKDKNDELKASELREAKKDETIRELRLRVEIFTEVLGLLKVTLPDGVKPEPGEHDAPAPEPPESEPKEET